MLAWTKQINTEGNADSRIIIKWSQSHATSNINNQVLLGMDSDKFCKGKGAGLHPA